MQLTENHVSELLEAPLHIVNVGLQAFASELERRGIPVIQVEWTPPAGGDPRLAELLSKLGT